MKKIFAITILVLGAISLTACGWFGDSTPTLVPTTEPNTINIVNSTFIPATMTVKKGTAVNWMNYDSVPHQIKSEVYNSSTMKKNQSVSFTFNTTGTFDYSCAVHPSMTGKIIVE